MEPSNEPPLSPEEHFALLAALHSDALALEKGREDYLASIDQDSDRTSRLRLLLVQQRLGRLQESQTSGKEMQALLTEQKDLLTNLHPTLNDVAPLRTRARLLQASVDEEERNALFQEIVCMFPKSQTLARNDTSTGTSKCPKGHLLREFTTPAASYSCDSCSTRFPQGAVLYSCRECNFDLCSSCFSGAGTAGPERPHLDAMFILSQAVLNIGPSNGDSIRQLTENAVGYLAHVAARSLFNQQYIAQEEHVLGAVCVEIFNVVKLSGRVALRKLLLCLSQNSARFSLSSAKDEGEAFLRLVLADLASGRSDEDRQQNVNAMSIDGYSFTSMFTLNQMILLGRLDPAIKSSEWYATSLLLRILPSIDEYTGGAAYLDVVPWEERVAFVNRLDAFAKELRTARKCTSLEFLVLHYLVKFDRERRKPLLPHSNTLANGTPSEMNLGLFKEYLNVEYREIDGIVPQQYQQRKSPQNAHSVNFLRSDNLCGVVARHLPLPTTQDDLQLIQAELYDIFSWKAATEADFAQYLHSSVIAHAYRTANATDPFESSSDPAVKFCAFNARHFPTQAPVELYCDLTGVKGNVSVKVFHVDAKQLYRKTKREISTAIPLDGLMPHEEFSFLPKLKGIRGREVIRLFSDKPCSGCFVVEVVANGMAARAVIRKGYLDCAERVESVGHVFFPFDPEATPRTSLEPSKHRVELWVDGKVYEPEPVTEGSTDMRVIVPFLDPNSASSQSVAVLTCEDVNGKRSSIFTFARRASNLDFRSSFFVDREALLSGNRQAKLLLRPSLWLAQSPVPLGLLTDVQVIIESRNAEGTESQETFQIDRAELQRGEIEKQFKVVPNIVVLRASLRAKLARTKDDVGCQDRFVLDGLNAQTNTVCPRGVFVMPRSDGTAALLVLGRSGEPIQDISVIVSFFVEVSERPIVWRTKTDAFGAVNLGSLAGVTRVQCQAGKDPELSTVYVVPRNVLQLGAPFYEFRALENDLVQVVCPVLPHRLPLDRQRFALLQVQSVHMKDYFSHLIASPQQGPFVSISGLPRGEYNLVISDLLGSDVHRIVICGAGPDPELQRQGLNNLRLPGSRGRHFVADARDGAYPVAIASVTSLGGGAVEVSLAGGSTTGRRVHAVARTFLRRSAMNGTLAAGVQRQNLRSQSPIVASVPPKVMYVPQRRLGDEMLYCTAREALPKVASTALDQPSQLVHPRDDGVTYTQVYEAQQGTAINPAADEVLFGRGTSEQLMEKGYAGASTQSFGAMRYMAPPSAAPPAMARMVMAAANQRPQNAFTIAIDSATNKVLDMDYSLDFLSTPSTTLCNLRPDPQTGIVRFSVDPRARWVEVLATDDDGTSFLMNAVLVAPEEQAPLDLTHRSKVALDAHIVEMQQVHLVEAGSKFEVGSLATGKVGVLDTFGSFIDFARAFRPSMAQTLDAMSFLRNWDTLDLETKSKLYAQHACHEFRLFLKRRDREFFDSHVRPQIRDRPKASRVFMDALLLDEDLAAFGTTVDDTASLALFERALLAVAIKETNPELARRLLRGLEDTTADEEETISSLRAAAFQTALLKGAADAEAAVQSSAMLHEETMDFSGDMAKPLKRMIAKKQAVASDQPMMVGTPYNVRHVEHTAQEEEGQAEEADKEMRDDEDDARAGDFDDGMPEEEAALIAQINKAATRDRYKERGRAHAWSERHFLTDTLNGAERLQAPFWAAFVRFHLRGAPGGCFLSADLCLPQNTTVTDGMLMLAVIDAPFSITPHRYDVRRDVGEMDIYPSSTCLIFHEQVTSVAQAGPSVSSSAGPSVLVGQTLLDPEAVARQTGSLGEEREPVELIVGKAYIARVVITNVTNVRRRVKLLLQIPDGALPLCGMSLMADRPSKTVNLWLEPFSTLQQFTALFYFPAAGQFGWFPAHVCSSSFNDSELLAFAAPRVLQVVAVPTIVDETSWIHLCSSRAATIDQICTFLEKERSLHSIALDKVAWRFLETPNGKTDWQRVVQVLERRGVYSPIISIFAMMHEPNSPRVGRALLATKFGQMAAHVGPAFKCKLVRFDVREAGPHNNTQEKLREMGEISAEVFPIVNARAHPLQSALQGGEPSANVRVSDLYQKFINELCFRSEPLAWELRLRYVILLLEAQRVATAKRVFRAGPNEGPGNAQRDYLGIYLAFLAENPLADTAAIARDCLQRAQLHLSHPNPIWRDRFARVINACTQILGEPSTSAVPTSDPEKSTQSELAARAPTFEVDLADNGGLVIVTRNVPEGSEFRINLFKMNVEHLFSSKPFAIALGAKQQDLGQFAYVLPNARLTAQLPSGEKTVSLAFPAQMASESVLIQVTFQAQQRVLSRFNSSLQVTMVEDFGILRVTNPSNAPVVLAYCKVYARKKAGQAIVFFKDGYTDLKGEFDYSGLNTMDAKDVAEFAVFISHPALGCLIRKVASPAV